MKLRINFLVVLFLIFCNQLNGLDNGLSLKPPMGWLQWARFVCELDCDQYPNECINDNLFRVQASILAKDYLKYGYEYINIDDCWSELKRDNQTKRLVPDKRRFPFGIKDLADFVHSKGLKLGLYGDIGTKTCQNYPGFQDENNTKQFYFELDSKTFAEWEIDSLKVDGCNGNTNDYHKLYPELGQYLNRTGRPILYSCSWPAYLDDKKVNYFKVAKYCNTWRNYDDISFSWKSVLGIIDQYVKNQYSYAEINGPGRWFDPDMIIIGNNGLSYEQMKAQFAIWSIWSAPLLMSNDLRKVSNEEKKILLNKHVIDVDQDEDGLMGLQIFKSNNFQIFLKPVSPIEIDNNFYWCFVIVYFNRNTLGFPKKFSHKINDIIMNYKFKNDIYNPAKVIKTLKERSLYFKVYDLFDNGKEIIDQIYPDQNLTLQVDVGGAVRMVKIVPSITKQFQNDFSF